MAARVKPRPATETESREVTQSGPVSSAQLVT